MCTKLDGRRRREDNIKWVVMKLGVDCGFSWPRIGSSGTFFEHGNELPVFVKDWEFLDYPKN
jgi:hypothetical protein